MADVRARFRRSQDDDKYTLPLGAPRMGAAEPFSPSPLTLPEARARASALTRLPRLPGRTNIQQEQLSEQLSTPQVAADVQPVVNGAPQGFRQPAAQVPAPTPRLGFSEDVTAPYTGVGLAGQQVASGPRIIRREGQSPLLTKLTGDRLDAAMLEPQRVGEYESLSDKGFAGVRSLAPSVSTPTGPTRNRFYNAEDYQSAGGDLDDMGALMAAAPAKAKQKIYDNLVAQGYDPAEAASQAELEYQGTRSAGGFRQARAQQSLRSGLTARRAAEADLGIRAQNAASQAKMAEAQYATALTNVKKALGVKLEKVEEEVPIDPENPGFGTQKKVTAFASTGAGVPVYIPLSDVMLYQDRLSAAKTKAEQDDIKRIFKEDFLSGKE